MAAQDLQVFPFHVALPQDAQRWPSTIGFAVLLLLVCLAARGPDWRFPGLARIAPAVTWLAGISYGLYLVHQELGYILARALLDLGLPGWLRLPVVVGAAVLAGWAVTAGVERPAHRWLTDSPEARRTAGQGRGTSFCRWWLVAWTRPPVQLLTGPATAAENDTEGTLAWPTASSFAAPASTTCAASSSTCPATA